MVLRTLLAHPTALADTRKDRLSLEEMLAESSANYNSLCANKDRKGAHNGGNDSSNVIQWTKSKIRALQEAMYHSAENENIEITLDLSNIGVPWTLHTWMQTLATSHEMCLEAITDQLLQDFLHLWPDDCSSQFVDECLPLLFSIFRHSKVCIQSIESTKLVLKPLLSFSAQLNHSSTVGRHIQHMFR